MTPAAPSTGRRRRGRELALRVLFEIEGTAKDPEFALRYQGSDLRATADVVAFARNPHGVMFTGRLDNTISLGR